MVYTVPGPLSAASRLVFFLGFLMFSYGNAPIPGVLENGRGYTRFCSSARAAA